MKDLSSSLSRTIEYLIQQARVSVDLTDGDIALLDEVIRSAGGDDEEQLLLLLFTFGMASDFLARARAPRSVVGRYLDASFAVVNLLECMRSHMTARVSVERTFEDWVAD